MLVFLLFSVWIFWIQSLHEVQGRNCVLMRFSSVQSDLFGSLIDVVHLQLLCERTSESPSEFQTSDLRISQSYSLPLRQRTL